MRKPVFYGSDQDRHNLYCRVTCAEYGSRLEMSDLGNKGIVIFMQ